MKAVLAILCYFLAGAASGASVNLAWDQPADSTIVGYTVHYGLASGSYNAASNVGNIGTTTIGVLADGATYFFVVNDYTVDGTTSPYSNEVSATTPSLGPSASFSANPSSGPAPLSVQFTNLSTNATSYAWAFGDGGTSTAVSPTYIYQSPGSFTATLSSTGAGGTAQAAALISVTQAPPPSGESLFTSQSPAWAHSNDGVDYELGLRFTSTSAGQITGLRFWKDSLETGTHVGHLWDAGGQLLASVTFVNETASGWQTQSLTSPCMISANTEYMVSVNTGAMYFVDTQSGLASVVGNGHLASIVGTNGRFGPLGQYPTQSYQASNYFRDVLFVADSNPSDASPPVVTISSPLNGATVKGNGSVTISASATDNVGVVSMSLAIDGVTVRSVTASSLSYSWNIRNVSRGQHSIAVTAKDAAGNVGTKSITVTRG